ncbi:MAG TPA: PA domain-containing protein [Steroidobacteraceae bacterium]|nr:PA domain-containing protein [Steroidobacteraceae bacterium]
MRTSFKAALAVAALTLCAAAPGFAQGKIIVVNGNLPGAGFNDPTPVEPIGGNPGVTKGEQRWNVFQYAADQWTAVLNPRVDIYVWARFVPLGTNVLGSAGPISAESDFDGAEYPGVWYHQALANHLKGRDDEPHDPTFLPNAGDAANPTDEISARFATGFNFYFGLDHNEESVPGTQDLLAVVLHEMGHGLGFSNLVDETTGAQILGAGDLFSQYTIDDTTNKIWNDMTDAERAASALKLRKVSWNGLHVKNDTPSVLQPGEPALVGHSPGFDDAYMFGTAQFGPPVSSPGITADVVLTDDGAAPNTDGCTAPINAVAGKIVAIDRGTCAFTIKTKLAQDAGALAVLVMNNAPGSPPPGMAGVDPTITIPAVMISQADGVRLKSALANGPVSVSLLRDNSVLAGTDRINHLALLATFDPVAPGSSISHFDQVAFPNQLMEPAINSDLTGSVTPPEDLTTSLFTDIGWFSDADGVPDGKDSCIGSDLRRKVFLGRCNTGAINDTQANGCTLNDAYAECSGLRTGPYVACIAKKTADFRKAKLIKPLEELGIVLCTLSNVLH